MLFLNIFTGAWILANDKAGLPELFVLAIDDATLATGAAFFLAFGHNDNGVNTNCTMPCTPA